MSTNAIVIFAKAPVPGQVKTRLRPHLTSEECAKLHEAFIIDTVRLAKGIDGTNVFISCHPDTAHPFFKGASEEFCIRLMPQKGVDLGQRMDNSIKDLVSMGYKKVVIVGSDSPDLPSEYIEDAFKKLDLHEMVIGPSSDGGYYLIGGTKELPVFDNIPWSTGSVFKLTIKKANERDIGYSILKEWHDVDTWEDLQLLLKRGQAS